MIISDVAVFLSVIRAHRLTIDEGFRGELAQLHENPGVRLNYFHPRAMFGGGSTVDEIGEYATEAGCYVERPVTVEVLDDIVSALSPAHRRQRSLSRAAIERDTNRAGRDAEAFIERTRNRRRWLFVCPCGDSRVRSDRAETRVRCEECDARLRRIEVTYREALDGMTDERLRASASGILDADSARVPF